MYKLFFNNLEFEKFAVKDLLKRGCENISAIREDDDFDLDELTVENASKKLSKAKISNPFVLSFLVKQMISMDKVNFKTGSKTLIAFYEMFLSLSILYGADKKSSVSE